jgi:hypothetical protein
MYCINQGEWKCTDKSKHSISIFETCTVITRLIIKEVNGITNEGSFTAQANICINGSNEERLSTSNNNVYINAYSMLITPSITLSPGKYDAVCSLYHSVSHGAYELHIYTSTANVEVK